MFGRLLPMLIASSLCSSSVLCHGFWMSATISAARTWKAHAATANPEKSSPFSSPEVAQEWDVDRYRDQHSFVWQYGSSLLELIDLNPTTSSSCPEGDRRTLSILDLGCGSGELTAALAERYPKAIVHGMDADASMIAQAQVQFPQDNLAFFQQDIRTLSTRVADDDNLYDVVFSNAALHWVPPSDAAGAVREISKVLRPGGQFVAEFGGQGNIQHIENALRRHLAQLDLPIPDRYWNFPSIADYTVLLQREGIDVTLAQLYDRPTPLDDGAHGLRNWIRMFAGPYLEELTLEQTEAVLTAVERDLESSVLWDGIEWKADYRRIRIVGRKLSA